MANSFENGHWGDGQLGVRAGKRRPAALLAAMALLALLVSSALAVHDTGTFQLDGDASTATQPFGPKAKDDWDKVCHEVVEPKGPGTKCSTTENTSGATAVAWTAETGLSETAFTGGGSKDPKDIPQWFEQLGRVPDKDNLLHSFAARYSLPVDPVGGETACPAPKGATSCDVLFFGSDRYDNSGSAQQGFWFLQNKITTGGKAGAEEPTSPASTEPATFWWSATSATAATRRRSRSTSGTPHAKNRRAAKKATAMTRT